MELDLKKIKELKKESDPGIDYHEIINLLAMTDGGTNDYDNIAEQQALLSYVFSVEKHINYQIEKIEKIKKALYNNRLLSIEEYDLLEEDFQNELSEKYDISHEFNNGILSLTLPTLLPHRIRASEVPYINTFSKELQKVYEKYHLEIAELLKENACMIVKHSYENSKMVRDNDNTELKKVVDLFQKNGLIKTDDGVYLSMIHIAEVDQKAKKHTTIYLTNKEIFKNNIGLFM